MIIDKILNGSFQLGVSEIGDITHVLGDDSTSVKIVKDEDSEAGSSKKLQTESLFYKDSSLFLKVRCFPGYIVTFDNKNLRFRALNHRIHTTITVNTLSTPVKDPKTSSETSAWLIDSRNTRSFASLSG